VTGPPVVTVTVPATSANLGPGFDSLGLALGLYDRVRVETAADGLTVDVTGEGAGSLPRDESHLVVRAARAAFDALGLTPPPMTVRCENRIPQGRGLGSSAAAAVAGVLAARALAGAPDDRAEALVVATGLEGHPDNAAACLLGGLTLAWTDGSGRPRAVRTQPGADLRLALLVPDTGLATTAARALLPDQVPHVDAAHTAGRAALLVEALTRRADLLLPATEDRLHQVYRGPAMPGTAALVADLRRQGLAAVVSGAGPSVLVLAADETALLGLGIPPGWTLERPGVSAAGAEVATGGY
jgi:homoserine kinase